MTSRSGKTVEIVNTDAEGRLILADALEYVQDKMEPQAILDFATLTGAVIDALGTVTSGIMGTHPGLVARVKAAAELTQERVWELPLYDEYEEDLKSHVADIKNSGIREAGSSKGGTFLKFFVDKKYPWVHCDIAGTSYHRRDANYHPLKYGSGVMVRLITHMLLDWKTIK
jgi:leucyl aminopeptidase